jgi:hypothetical protein
MKKLYLINFEPDAGLLQDIVVLDDTHDVKQQVLDYLNQDHEYDDPGDAPFKPSVIEAVYPLVAVDTNGQQYAITLDGVSPKPEAAQ